MNVLLFTSTLGFLLVLALLELWFFPLPFAFVALFLWGQLYSEEQAMLLAFLLGFIFDVLIIRSLGTTSLTLVTILFITMLYKRKYASHNLIFLGVAMFLSTLALTFILYKRIAIGESIASTIITIFFVRIFSTRSSQYESWYRIS